MNGISRSCPILQYSFPFADSFGKNEDSMICFKSCTHSVASLAVAFALELPGLQVGGGAAVDPGLSL